jgi:hypothetical protein
MNTLYIALLICLIVTPTAWGEEVALFFIERNKNKNEVHYQLHVDKNCQIASDEPVTGFWKMLEENPGKTKPFSMFDKMAYSVVNQKVENNWVYFSLKALETKLIKATAKHDPKAGACIPIVQVKINEQWASLDHIYVFSKDGFLMPKVMYVDVIGKSLEPHPEQVSERITP